jgi:hypothetical protein
VNSRIAFEPQIPRLLTEWQKRLRLRDWNVKCTIEPYPEVNGYGRTTCSLSLKEACIRICDPADEQFIKEMNLGTADLEVTLVHELLHLHGETFDHVVVKKKQRAEHCGLEQMIECTAQALVALKREAQQ